MSSILSKIAQETNGKSFKTFKYSFDSIDMPSFNYDDNQQITWKEYGETVKHTKPVNLEALAKKIIDYKPVFTFFLDGSRRTFKVDDFSYRDRVYPVVAGQIGIGCLKRENKKMQFNSFTRSLVITLPDVARTDDWADRNLCFQNIKNKVNEEPKLKSIAMEFTDILPYSTRKDEVEKMENKAIAVIQDLMIEKEKAMVAELVSQNMLNYSNYLLKDGSLEYRVHNIKNERELVRFKNNFNWVIGASKTFNPENCKDIRGKSNSQLIADLPLHCRTPVSMYQSQYETRMHYAVWYVRIREKKYTSNPFDGILKLEKILTTESEIENKIDSELIDMITANIINERNPVCYGDDFRWANHLYPIYATERFVKSKYLSNTMFLNLF